MKTILRTLAALELADFSKVTPALQFAAELLALGLAGASILTLFFL